MICVGLLESQYAQLSNLGFPFSFEQGGLALDNAKLSSRLSDEGFWCPSRPLPKQLRLLAQVEKKTKSQPQLLELQYLYCCE